MTDKTSPKKNRKDAPKVSDDPVPGREVEQEPTEDSEETEVAFEAEPELLKRLEEAETRADQERDKALRAMAELDNFRKRMARDRQEWLRTAAADVIQSLLPALDNLKLGLQTVHDDQSARELARGFEMVGQQFLSALAEQGLKELDPAGENFDPHLHDSISAEPSADVAEGMVLRTVKTGYLLNDKLLRPAMVVVSSGAPEGANAEAAPGAAGEEIAESPAGESGD